MGALLGIAVAVLLLAALARWGKWGHGTLKPLPERVDFAEAVLTTVRELDDALYLYVMFMAIEHDNWLASEASMVETSVKLTGLPVKERAEDLLDLLPGVKKDVGKDLIEIYLPDSPAVDMMETGVVLYPKEGRVSFLQGRLYTQDGYGGLIAYFEGASACQFTVDLKFLLGDYGDPGDLDNYRIRLAGTLENDRISLQWAGGRIGSPEKVQALLAAAGLFGQVSAKRSYTFESDAEAERVQQLAGKVAGDVSGVTIRPTAEGYVADDTFDVAILLCYERYAKTVFKAD